MQNNKAGPSSCLLVSRIPRLVLYAQPVAFVLAAQPRLTDDLLQLGHRLEHVHVQRVKRACWCEALACTYCICCIMAMFSMISLTICRFFQLISPCKNCGRMEWSGMSIAPARSWGCPRQ